MKLCFLKICCFLAILTYILSSCDLYKNRPIAFDKKLWNSWDIIYDEKRYNMAMWFFKNNWFEGKTKTIILDELTDNNEIVLQNHKEELENSFILFTLLYLDNYQNIDYVPPRTAVYLKIYFDNDGIVSKTEMLEIKKHELEKEERESSMDILIEKYKIIKYWNKK